MKLDLILAYRNLNEYIEKGANELNWNETMVNPYWGVLTEGAPFPMDHMKPICKMDEEEARRQLELLDRVDWEKYMSLFEEICAHLPKDDEEVIHIAIYPSTTDMPEGVYGTGVWGNIILNINPTNNTFEKWLPFVFAHEYHHSVWGDYWYCKKEGKGLEQSFLQMMIIEGEADDFAMSLHGGFVPSWHRGVSKEQERKVWEKIKEVMDQAVPPEEYARYMFGDKELGIPENAGYYYAIKIVQDYKEKHKGVTYKELLQILPREIYCI